MRQCVWRTLLAVCLLCSISLVASPAAFAAPGDFLFQWGVPYLFNGVQGVAVDSGGNLYVIDYYRVQVLDKSGALVTSWGSYGSGNNQFRAPIDVAVAPNRVYVSDRSNVRVQVFDTSGNFVRTLVSGGFFGSGNIATDESGNVYVIDSDNERIQIFDSNGNLIRVFGSSGTGNDQFANIQDLAVDEAGNIYVSDNNRIKVFTNTGTFLRAWGPHGTDPVNFGTVAVDDFGNVYVGEVTATMIGRYDKVQVFDSSGNFLREWGSFGYGDGQFNGIHSIEAGEDGNIYVSDANYRVQIFDSSGRFLRKLGGSDANGQFNRIEGVAVDGAGKVYVSDTDNYRFQVFDGSGKFLWKAGSYGSGDGQFNFLTGLAVDKAGNVYAADATTTIRSRIQIFDSSGRFLSKWNLPSGTANPAPGGVALDSGGNVYVTDSTNNRIIMFGLTGNVIRTWGSAGFGNGQFNYPNGVAVDLIGNIYVADTNNQRIQVFDNNGNFLRSWGGSGSSDGLFNTAFWVAVDGVGNVYVTDYNSSAVGRVQVFDSGGKFLGKWGSYGSGPGQFGVASGIAATASGDKVYLGDWDHNRIQAYTGFGGELPAGWASRDIGSVRLPGRDGYQNGTFTLEGAGDNIWGTADSFHFVYKALSGDGQITARVASVQNTNGYAKGGVMIRETLAANSAHAMMDLTPVYGAEFSRRLTTGGSTTVSATAGIAAPAWVRLVRQGSSFSGYFSRDGVTWTLAGTSTINMASSVYIGLIANSHSNLTLCTTTLDSVSVTGQTNAPLVTITAPAQGTTYNAPANVTVSADAVAGTGATVSKVEFYSGTTLIGTDTSAPYTTTWNNVGAGSYSLSAKVTDSSGATATSAPVQITVSGSTFPAPWVTQDVGSVGVAGSASYQNGTFTVRGSGGDIWGTADAFRFVYQPINGNGQIIARVVSVQNTNTYAKAGVMIRQSLSANSMHAMMDLRPTGGGEFSRRTSTGGTTAATTRSGISAPYWVKLVRSGSTFTGSVSSDGVTWVQVGSASISMTSTVLAGLIVNSHSNSTLCSATFDSVTVIGGGDTVAPVVTAFAIPATSTSLTVPITTLTASDAVGVTGYLVNETPTKPSASAAGWSATKPVSYTFATSGTKTLYAWAKDAAGNVSESRSATVTVSGGALPTPWLTQDIGSVGLAGSAKYLNGTFELKGSGTDIYATVDAFRYVYKVMTGDGEIIARVASLQNTNSYAKGGVMMRNSLAANSMHAMVDLTPGHGVEFSRRTTTGGSTTPTGTSGYAAPSWVRLVRSGNTFTGYVSSDGVNWRQLGSSTINMSSSIYVGLIVNSHNNTVLCTTTIDHVR